MENSGKRREWVKTVAIIFLAILLVLTFFSNTISNMSLPEVSTVEVTDGSITAKVRATGKVSAIGNNEVKAEGTRTIAAVKVKAGQEVNEGDILFVMGEAGTEELEVATDARDSAYYANERAKVSYPTNTAANQSMWRAECELEDAENLMNAAEAQLLSAASDPEVLEAKALSEALYSYYLDMLEIEQGDDGFGGAKKIYEDERANVEELQQKIDVANIELGGLGIDTPEREKKEAEIRALEIQMVDANFALTEAERQYSSAQSNTSAAYNEYMNAESKYQTTLSSVNSSLKSAYDIAVSRYNSARSAYNSASDSYMVSTENFNQSWAQANINVQEAQNTLDKKQAKVDNLQGVGEDVNVYAKVSGIVNAVNFSSGDKVIKDDIMCVIEVPDMGYKMEVSVTKDQANRLKVGDVGTATNYYWGKSTEGTVTAIRTDPKDPQSKRIIEFDIDGDVENGQELTLSVGQKSASYDYLVPKSAVKSDNNGYFVLVITSKNNALGNRYFAKRVPVEILAEDDSNRAISGDLGYGDFVITNSSTKVNSGDQVKLADS
ncbi:MAG: efflux RND transporter periplasmic adaptor subunit [Eubacteriales bacterium]|nr:efflux RND transporter periplasmic adaptor subunit [Eubacteriales bacterium]